jgi:uncharacterized membrane-anchored protein
MALGVGEEQAVKWTVQKIQEKIEKNKDSPEAVRVLRELCIEEIEALGYIPEWAPEWAADAVTKKLLQSKNP